MEENKKRQDRDDATASRISKEQLDNLRDDASNRGGTTDLNNEAVSGQRPVTRGSSVATKNSVTGSDFDGQVSSD